MADKDKKLSDGTDVPVGAEHEMLNLDVEEVSLVSRPAIKRKFLVRKSEGLEVEEVELQEQEGLNLDTFKSQMEDKYVPKEEPKLDVAEVLDRFSALRKSEKLNKEAYLSFAQEIYTALEKSEKVDLADLGGHETEEDFVVSAVYHMALAKHAPTNEEEEVEQLNHLQFSYLALLGAAKADEETIVQVSKGKSLGTLLSNAISRKAKNRADRAVVVQQLADAAGITTEAVYMITTGKIKCPPQKRLAAFAKVLNISESSLKSAARKDGCKLQKEEETMNKLVFDKEKQAIFAEVKKEDGSVELQEVQQEGLFEELKKHFTPETPQVQEQQVEQQKKEEPVQPEQKTEQQSDHLRKEFEKLTGLIAELGDQVKKQSEHIEKLEKAAPLSSSDEPEKPAKQKKEHPFNGFF